MILIEKLNVVLIVIFKGKINIISRYPVFSLPVALSFLGRSRRIRASRTSGTTGTTGWGRRGKHRFAEAPGGERTCKCKVCLVCCVV